MSGRAASGPTAGAVGPVVDELLSTVMDSCSVAAGNPISIVDMGLVQDSHLDDDGTLVVVLRGTFPGCTMLPHFAEAAQRELSAAFDRVEIRLSTDTSWSPGDLAPEARAALERRRAAVPVDIIPWAHRRKVAS